MSVPALSPRLAHAFSGRIGLGCVTFGREIDQAAAADEDVRRAFHTIGT